MRRYYTSWAKKREKVLILKGKNISFLMAMNECTPVEFRWLKS